MLLAGFCARKAREKDRIPTRPTNIMQITTARDTGESWGVIPVLRPTDAPAAFEGTLAEVCALDIENDAHGRGIFIAALNAVMCRLGIVGCTVHCRGDGPELCAPMTAERIRCEYGTPRIALIGYQPALLAELSKEFTLRVLDLDPKNIGQLRSGVLVEDGGDEALRREICAWAGLILCTGSTVCNGSIVDFLGYENALFYGTSIAGAAALMDLPRLCFTDELQ